MLGAAIQPTIVTISKIRMVSISQNRKGAETPLLPSRFHVTTKKVVDMYSLLQFSSNQLLLIDKLLFLLKMSVFVGGCARPQAKHKNILLSA